MRAIRGTKQVDLDTKKVPTNKTETNAAVRPKNSALADALKRVLADHGLSQEELAELLSGYTSKNIARTALAGWLRGAEPRISSDSILDALQRIDKAEGRTTKSAYVEAQEVRAYVKQKLEIMTRKQLMIAGELPQSTFQQWEAGIVRVNRRRFDRIKSLIELWEEVARQAGALK